MKPVAPEHLADIESIKQLKARYFRSMDCKDWPGFGDVFTKDATLRWGDAETDVFNGRDEIVERLSGILKDCITTHHGHMPEIEITSPGHARGIWAMFDRVDHPAYRLVGYGHYHESYVLDDGQWRIARLVLTRLHVDTQPKHSN